MKNSFLTLITILCLFSLQGSFAKIKLPGIISSNMVLQRNASVKLWGWAAPGEKITIETSWTVKKIKVVANANGRWEINVLTTLNKEPQTINLKSAESNIKLENILFGEVWVCSGQSNMRQPLKGYTGQPVFDGNKAIATSGNDQIRFFSINENGADTALDTLIKYKKWDNASPELAKDFSAIAYFYGKQLQEILGVPVGLIMTSWGGTKIQPWISKESFAPFLDSNNTKIDAAERFKKAPSAIFNAMINPITSYTIKGILWYQGESNRKEPELYQQLFSAMVEDWRSKWNIGDFPFYYVQIAPNNYVDKSSSQYLREVQLRALNVIPNSGMAVTSDIGSDVAIHPPKKKEVAERLLFMALNKTYGMKDIDYLGPVYKSMEPKESSLILTFDNAETGLFCFDKELSDFEIAGADKVFYPAKAEILKGRQVKVSSLNVKKPVAVRYGWKDWFLGSLFDTNLLPASSFRTDDWD
jgi:sialate O-acetylesterase